MKTANISSPPSVGKVAPKPKPLVQDGRIDRHLLDQFTECSSRKTKSQMIKDLKDPRLLAFVKSSQSSDPESLQALGKNWENWDGLHNGTLRIDDNSASITTQQNQYIDLDWNSSRTVATITVTTEQEYYRFNDSENVSEVELQHTLQGLVTLKNGQPRLTFQEESLFRS